MAGVDSDSLYGLILQLDYFETILNPYFTHEARESLKTLQGALLEKATESVTETIETPSHSRRPTRGSDDVLQDERQQGASVSPDDLIVRNTSSLSTFFQILGHVFSLCNLLRHN